MTTIITLSAVLNQNRRILLDDRFAGELRLLMIEVNNTNVQLILWIDSQPYVTTVQQLIDAGLDERVSDGFYMTKIDPVGNSYVVLYNPERPTPVKDRVYWEVANLAGVPININRYQYLYNAEVEYLR